MKGFILVLLLFISPIELRLRTNDDIYELDELLKKYDRYNYRPNKPYIPDDGEDDGGDEQEEYIPPSYHKKVYPSRKKVLDNNDDDGDDQTDNEDIIPKTTKNDGTSLCFNGYDTRSEQLVKIKELKNGAHMIRYTLIDKRSLESNHNIKDNCMLDCCSDKNCDLAMLSEQPTHEGYKCYLFSCNGSCTLAYHQDYSVLTPKKDSMNYITSLTTNIDTQSTTTVTTSISTSPVTYKKKSFLRETSVIIFLIFGIISTIVLFVFIFQHCRASHKRGRKSTKNYSVDSDYLINGLYL